MRERLAKLNPTASAKIANRLIEAHERNYWSPSPTMLDALRRPAKSSRIALKALRRDGRMTT